MRNVQFNRRMLLFLLPLFLLAISMSGNAGEGGILIIANAEVVPDSLSRKMVSDIYQGYRGKWDNGRKIKVVMLKTGATHNRFSEEIVQISPDNLKKLWKKVIFSGAGTPPKILRSEEKCVAYVAATQGAIGYISSSTSHEGVKVISIQ